MAKSFYRGYQLLYKKGFLGQYDDVNELLRLIESIFTTRLVHSSMFNLPMKKSFSFSRIDNAVEWDEVETIAKELFELAKSQQSQTDVSQSAPTVSDQEGDTEQSASGDSDEEGDEQSDDQSDDQSDGESESSESGESGSLMKVKRLKMRIHQFLNPLPKMRPKNLMMSVVSLITVPMIP